MSSSPPSGASALISFGGPAGQIALMHRVLVEERRWLSEERFLHALNFCMLLPGPEAMQLATYSGWLLRGVKGGVLAGLLFVLPGFCVVLALSILYVTLGDVPVVSGLLLGLKAAVLAIVAEALVRVSRKGLRERWQALVAVAAFLALALFDVPFPLVILAAAAIGLWAATPVRDAAPSAPISHAHVGRTLVVWLAVWLLPAAGVVLLVGSVWGREALFFSQAAIVTFGGAYAVLAYVAQRAVEDFGWLAPGEMATGLGLGGIDARPASSSCSSSSASWAATASTPRCGAARLGGAGDGMGDVRALLPVDLPGRALRGAAADGRAGRLGARGGLGGGGRRHRQSGHLVRPAGAVRHGGGDGASADDAVDAGRLGPSGRSHS